MTSDDERNSVRRVFIALNIPLDVRREIYDAAAPLRELQSGISWTPAERLHLTLKFLGDQNDESRRALSDAVAEVASRQRTLALDVSTVGGFPTLRRPRVIWAGVRADPKLELLQHDIEEATHRRGFELDGRAFRPHITIGRVRGPLNPEVRRSIVAAARRVRLQTIGPVDSIDLMESAAERGGRVYRVLVAAPLIAR